VKITLPGDSKRGPLREKIARVIRESILQGALKPGEQLVEAALARRMNVSRASLREAFQFLERQGYVRIIPRNGTFVARLTSSDIAEITVLRDALEPITACGASKNLEPEDAQALRCLLSAMRGSADEGDHRQYYENDLHFHQKIWRLSGNRRLDDVLNMACIPLFTNRIVHSHLQKDQLMQSLIAHEAIFKAIVEGDGARLKTVVRAAIQGGAELSPDQTENDGRLSVRQRSGAKNKDGPVRG
jgi:DNA-binding GntR family transcriptional regulator